MAAWNDRVLQTQASSAETRLLKMSIAFNPLVNPRDIFRASSGVVCVVLEALLRALVVL